MSKSVIIVGLVISGAAVSAERYPGFYDSDAGVVCLQSVALNAMLARQYHEETIARGTTKDGFLLEIWSSPNGQTWTVVIQPADGASCITASGKNLESLSHAFGKDRSL